MSDVSGALDVRRDGRRRRFIGTVSSGIDVSYLSYRVKEGTVDFYHTQTLPDHQGKGYASKVVEEALSWAHKQGLKVIPSCSYVKWLFESRGKLLNEASTSDIDSVPAK